jgi:ABC-2 type transport system permease protein
VVISYVVIFVFIALMVVGSGSDPTTDFQETLVNVTLVNEDDDTELVNSLTSYLAKYVTYVDVKPENYDDALYFREIYMVITIPKNFTNDLLEGKDVNIIKQSIPGNIANVTAERAINKFLNLVRVYKSQLPDSDNKVIMTEVNKVLTTEVNATRTVALNNDLISAGYFYNFLSYIFIAILISVGGMIILRLRKLEIKRRMAISPYTQTKTNLEILLGNLVFTIGFTVIMIVISVVLYPQGMKTANGIWLMLNALCLGLTCLSFAFCISLLAKDDEVLSAMSNVVGLGTAFLTGAFVPQEMLSKGILSVAHVFPNYYYIANNNKLVAMQTFNWNNLKGIVLFMIIQLLFAVLFAILSIVITKKQAQKEA